MDMWPSLSNDSPSPRSEMVHNIDPIEETWAVRVGNYKLVYGKSGATYAWQNWYPQPDGNASVQVKQFPQDMFRSGIEGVLMSIGRNITTGLYFNADCKSFLDKHI